MTAAEKLITFAKLAAVHPDADMLARCKRDLASLRSMETTDSALLSTMGGFDLQIEIDVLEGKWKDIGSF